MPKKQLISSDEAVPAKAQIVKPCSDCPLSRESLNGWLGGGTPEDWGHALHSESPMNCHVLEGAQCAGAAIYRSNICKRMVDKSLLVLPEDRVRRPVGTSAIRLTRDRRSIYTASMPEPT